MHGATINSWLRHCLHCRLGSTDADEFTLKQQNVKTKAATKYTVKVLSDFMLEKKYDGEIGTMDIVVLNGIMC